MTEPRWLNPVESRAWRALQHLNMPLSAALNRQLARDSNLSNADYAVLVQLSESAEQRLRARDMVQAIGWEKSRLSHHIRRMESRQLVSREECPTDGRGAFITLTPIGRAAIEQAAPGHVAAVRSYFIDLLTPAQLESFAEIAEAVGARLDSEGCGGGDGVAEDPCQAGVAADYPDEDAPACTG